MLQCWQQTWLVFWGDGGKREVNPERRDAAFGQVELSARGVIPGGRNPDWSGGDGVCGRDESSVGKQESKQREADSSRRKPCVCATTPSSTTTQHYVTIM